jgi:hypothetical protein
MIEAFLSTKKQNGFRSFGQRSVTVRNRKSKKVSLSPATNRTPMPYARPVRYDGT